MYRGKYKNKESKRKTLNTNELLQTIERIGKESIIFNNYQITNKNGTDNIQAKLHSSLNNSFKESSCLYGHILLPELYDLYLNINTTDSKEKKSKLIIDFCKRNSYPYNFTKLYDLRFNIKTIKTTAKDVSKNFNEYLQFETNKFIDDLNNLCFRLENYLIISNTLETNDVSYVRNRIKANSLFTYFEVTDNMSDIETLKYIKTERNRILRTSLFHSREISLRVFIDSNGNANFIPKLDSVFDIGWLTFYRLLTKNGFKCDNSGVILNSNTKMIKCPSCGRFFIKQSSRQKYCGCISCEIERKRLNKMNYDDRKRDKKKVSELKAKRAKKDRS